MDTSMTLQDFVLNLIYDPAARSAFELDPESVLEHAGLGDVTAADVRQVIPLVVDSAPVTGLHAPAGVDDLATGVANLDVAGAVSHLQAITAQVAYSATVTGDAGVSMAGAATSVVSGSVLTGSVLTGPGLTGAGLTGSGLTGSVFTSTDVHAGPLHAGFSAGAATSADLGGLSTGNDPGLHLDTVAGGGVATPAGQTATDVHAAVDHAPGLETSLTGGLDAISGLPLDHTPDLDVAGVGGAVSSIGSVVSPDLGHALSGDPVNDLHNTVTTITGGHDVTGDLLHGVTHPAEQDPLHDLLGGLHS
jgi:hypothetical protein